MVDWPKDDEAPPPRVGFFRTLWRLFGVVIKVANRWTNG
jgi:hypothetical protein